MFISYSILNFRHSGFLEFLENTMIIFRKLCGSETLPRRRLGCSRLVLIAVTRSVYFCEILNSWRFRALIKPNIERTVQELVQPVIERTVRICVTTCEQMIKKDFALDPEEIRMRRSAMNITQHLTATMAMVTCKEPLLVSCTNNLRNAFNQAQVILFHNIPSDVFIRSVESEQTLSVLSRDQLKRQFLVKRSLHSRMLYSNFKSRCQGFDITRCA